MRSVVLFFLLLVSFSNADLPSCVRARCAHCAVEFIARMCPSVCSSCPKSILPNELKETNVAHATFTPLRPSQTIEQQRPIVIPQTESQSRINQLPPQPPPAFQQPQPPISRPQQSGVPTVQSSNIPHLAQQSQLPPQSQTAGQQVNGATHQEGILPPSPLFNPQPLNIPPPPAAIPLPPYSPPIPSTLPQQPQSFNGNYATHSSPQQFNHFTPQQVQPSPPQHPQFNPFQHPQQPFNPFNPFQPFPSHQVPQQPFDIFHPNGQQHNLLTPQQGVPQGGLPPSTQQSNIFNPFAPFLHQSYAAGGITPPPQSQFNPFTLPNLGPSRTTPPPLQPLPPTHTSFFDNRQQPQPLPSSIGQPQPSIPQQQVYNTFPQQNHFQIPPMGALQMGSLPQIPPQFNPQPPTFVPPSPSSVVQTPQQPPQTQPAVLTVQAPQISTSIDSSPTTFNKAQNVYVGVANKGGSTIEKTQCPNQPGWRPCISKELANERFRNCCSRLGDGCLPLCDYDATLTNMQLAVLTGRCPLAKVGDVMMCASGYEDATSCCQAYGVFEPGYEHCRPYCNPAAGLPEGGLLSEKYKCLVKLSHIQQCFYVTQRP